MVTRPLGTGIGDSGDSFQAGTECIALKNTLPLPASFPRFVLEALCHVHGGHGSRFTGACGEDLSLVHAPRRVWTGSASCEEATGRQ